MKRNFVFFVSMMSCVLLQTAMASQVLNSAIENTTPESGVVSVSGNAKDWGLSDTEWSEYLSLMQGVDGLRYQQLIPAAVLGMRAKTLEEQRHFAEIVAREEHDRAQRELAFNNAVTQALKRLYKDERIIKDFDMSPFDPKRSDTLSKKTTALKAGDHVVLFEDVKQGMDVAVLPKLIALVKQHRGMTLDIYFVGSSNDLQIQSWAKQNHIPLELVGSGRITLNHDRGKLKKTTGKANLPIVVLMRGRKTQLVSPWDLG